ncbi:MAG: hypothetical protein ACI9U2_001892 [Bradymonadia bacterium]|jgi:hypothetical protein
MTAALTPPGSPKLPKRVVDLIARMGDAFDKIDALLLRLGVQGVQRLSRASVDELGALKQTANAAGLIYISRELDTLATLTTRYLDRDPTFAMRQFVGAINRVWLLNRAARVRHATGELPEAMLELNGRARRSFEILDHPLDVQTLGAFGWVTDSGYVGVTLHCEMTRHADETAHADETEHADPPLGGQAQSRGLVQLSVARPTMHFGTDPEMLYGFALNDALTQSPRDMAHGAYQLRQAKLSSDNRLSMHADLQIAPAAYRGGSAYAAYRVTDWRQVVERIRAADASPVKRTDGVLILAEAQSLSAVVQDQTRAIATANLRDARGAVLTVHVPMRTEHNTLIDNLERLARSPRPHSLFGRAWIEDDALRFMPYTAVYAEPQTIQRFGRRVHTVHLSLERPADSDVPQRRRRSVPGS